MVREWAENGGAYYPLLECRRLTDIEDVRKSEDILNRLEFIDRRFLEFISIMSEYNRNDKSKNRWERELSEYPPEKIYQVRREGGFAPIFPDTCYHLTHYWPAAADIPVASDNPVHYADAIRYNARTPLQGSLLPLTRLV